MKRGLGVLFFVSIVLVLSISVVSAGWFTDFFAKITGSATNVGTWTPWYDNDEPTASGDWEDINALRSLYPGQICNSPTDIECQTTFGVDYTQTGQNVTCNVNEGFYCINANNPSGCHDYRVRFYCTTPTESGVCSGTAIKCDEFDSSTCSTQKGCSYESGIDICAGTASSCSSLATQTSCRAQAGCSWTATPTCTDSDGGLNYYVKGTTTFEDDEGEDNCLSGDTLNELYCTADKGGAGQSYTCPNGCFDGACYGVADEQYTLEEGQEMNIQIQDIIYNTEIIYVGGTNSVKFNINGELTNTLGEGESQKLSNGNIVFVYDIILKAKEGGNVWEVTFSLSSAGATCTDSDGGKNYYVKGTAVDENGDEWEDTCFDGASPVNSNPVYEGDYLYERFCPEPGVAKWDAVQYCSNGCVDGACVKVNYNGTCSELVNEIANPSDFEKYGAKYSLGWSNSYNSSWWVWNNGSEREYSFTEYYAYWSINYPEGDNYQYGSLSENVMIFDDKTFDTSTILEDMTRYNFCQIHGYNDERVYVCNWNIYERGVDIDQSDWKNREVLWNNGNVLVRFSIGFGKWLSDDEINQIIEKETLEFLNSLKDNQAKYVGWEQFDIAWPFDMKMFNALESCPSDISENTCSPQWRCITEPTVCPEHGYQTQTCQDYSCERETMTNQISCNPGICSGCLVPKWFSPYYTDLGENRCIPYGFRFESEIGWHEGEQTDTSAFKFSIADAIDEGVNLSISSDGLATLFVEDWGNEPYVFREGEKVEIDVTGWDENIISFSFVATGIVYDANNYEDSYVVFEFTETYLGRVVDTINAYCDFDGYVKPQKTKEASGAWARCQNNYECDSNLCSSGSCIELGDIAGEASAFKVVIVKFFCRITNILDNSDYNQCLADNGISETTTQ